MPTLYAALEPSTVTSRIRPSDSWPTALRAPRVLRIGSPNVSFVRKTALPPVTRRGPPPIAYGIVPQFGVSVSRSSTVVPAGASAVRCGICVPRETSTAPPGGIGVPPCDATEATVPLTTALGRVGGSDWITSSTTAVDSVGVTGPHAEV